MSEPLPIAKPAGAAGWRSYGGMLLVVAGCTAVAAFMDRHFDPSNLTMIYLLGVVVTAIAFGRGPAVWAALLSVAVFDFAFVPPRFTFTVADTQYLITFGVMLVVAIVIGTLTAGLREQREAAVARELERRRLAEAVDRVRMEAETERMRSMLLSSVSHDLRTPLASITGAASSLRDGAGGLSAATRVELADTIAEEAMRLNRLIGNLLDMTRLESGGLHLKKEWHSLEEVVGAALARLEATLGDRTVRLDLEAELPLVPLDGVLFEQVVRNLVENAHKYSRPGDPIEISAVLEADELRFTVADRGIGFAPGEDDRLFEKFYRGANASGRPGVGLGLAICQAIVHAHGGTIEAANRPGGGAHFTVFLPVEGAPAMAEGKELEDAPARTGS